MLLLIPPLILIQILILILIRILILILRGILVLTLVRNASAHKVGPRPRTPLPEIEKICAGGLEMGAAWWPLFLRKVIAWTPKRVHIMAPVLGSVVEKN